MKRTLQTMRDELGVLTARRTQLDAEIGVLKKEIARHPDTVRAIKQAEQNKIRARLPSLLHRELLPHVADVTWAEDWQDADGTFKFRQHFNIAVATKDTPLTTYASGLVKKLGEDDFMGLATPKPSDTFKRTWEACKALHDGKLGKALAALILLAARWNEKHGHLIDDPRLLLRYQTEAFANSDI